MAKNLVVISGNLGAGKSTLAAALAKRLRWVVMNESLDENPYLADFYRDMETWAFHLQVYFLGIRAEQHRAASALQGSVLLDRSLYEDFGVFAPALRELGYISKRDYETYERLIGVLLRQLQRPDIVLFVSAPPRVLLERIRQRNCPFDQNLSLSYLELIQRYYDRWLVSATCPVIRIESTQLDFRTDSGCEAVLRSFASMIEG